MCRVFKLQIFVICLVLVKSEVFEKCSLGSNLDEFLTCATSKALKTIKIAQNLESMQVFPGVILARNASDRAPKELDLEVTSTQKPSKLIDILFSATTRFLSSRTLKIEIPLAVPESVSRSLDEGRGKMKKMMGPLLLGLGTKMMSMVPFMFGSVFLLTTKALLIGKIAFVLSVVLFVQAFFSGRFFPHGGGTYTIPSPSYGVPFNTNYGGYGYGGYNGFGGTNSIGGGWGTSGQFPNARSIDDEEKTK